MNKELENIFDKALSELKQGASVEEAVLKCQPEQAELADSLLLAHKLSGMPKKTVPQPAMQRKYVLVPAKAVWYSWLHFSRLASISMSLALFLSAAAGTGYAAYYSMPGQALFAVKKTAENLQLQFATSPEKKISLQVEFSKKRLMDVEKILKNPESSPETAKAAVKELSEQTKNTLETVSSASKKDLDPQKTRTLVKTLETIAVDQEKLAKEAKTGTTKEIAANVEASAKTINNYILIAANELEKSNIQSAKPDLENEKETASSTTTAINEQLKTEKSTTSSSSIKSLIVSPALEPEAQPDPNAATSGYIPETPEPQYVPGPSLPTPTK